MGQHALHYFEKRGTISNAKTLATMLSVISVDPQSAFWPGCCYWHRLLGRLSLPDGFLFLHDIVLHLHTIDTLDMLCSWSYGNLHVQTASSDLHVGCSGADLAKTSIFTSFCFCRRWYSSTHSGNSFLNIGFLRFCSKETDANRRLSALDDDMLPVVMLFSYMKESRPFRIVPTLHMGFQLSAGGLPVQ